VDIFNCENIVECSECTPGQECTGFLPTGTLGGNCYPSSGGISARSCQPDPRHFTFTVLNTCTQQSFSTTADLFNNADFSNIFVGGFSDGKIFQFHWNHLTGEITLL
jgi:hypothetical protein